MRDASTIAILGALKSLQLQLQELRACVENVRDQMKDLQDGNFTVNVHLPYLDEEEEDEESTASSGNAEVVVDQQEGPTGPFDSPRMYADV